MTKIVTFLLSPLGILFALLLLAAWWMMRDRRWLAVCSILLAGLWLYAWSCPVVESAVIRWWEARVPNPAIAELPAVEVAVVLGGAMGEVKPPRQHPDLNQAADRYWHAARLYHAGKAKQILVSGGGYGETSEAALAAIFLVDLGVAREAILLEERSLNTIENARESAVDLEPLEISRILLVTSATHMPRAMQAFRHVGLDPIPVPTDYRGVSAIDGWRAWLPSPDALHKSSVAVKEVIGYGWYWIRYGDKQGGSSGD